MFNDCLIYSSIENKIIFSNSDTIDMCSEDIESSKNMINNNLDNILLKIDLKFYRDNTGCYLINTTDIQVPYTYYRFYDSLFKMPTDFNHMLNYMLDPNNFMMGSYARPVGWIVKLSE